MNKKYEDHKLYYVTVTWYNIHDEKDVTNHFYTFAINLVDLTDRIEQEFDDISDVNIHCVNSMCGIRDFFWCDEVDEDARRQFEDSNDY